MSARLDYLLLDQLSRRPPPKFKPDPTEQWRKRWQAAAEKLAQAEFQRLKEALLKPLGWYVEEKLVAGEIERRIWNIQDHRYELQKNI